MKTKKIISMFLIGLVFTTTFAQKKMNAQEMADYQTEIMAAELQLNDETQNQIAPINLKYAKKMIQVIQEGGGMFSKMGRMKDIKKSKNTELEKILTKEQMEKYQDDVEPKMRKHLRKQMME